jgi:hypothetical protein
MSKYSASKASDLVQGSKTDTKIKLACLGIQNKPILEVSASFSLFVLICPSLSQDFLHFSSSLESYTHETIARQNTLARTTRNAHKPATPLSRAVLTNISAHCGSILLSDRRYICM